MALFNCGLALERLGDRSEGIPRVREALTIFTELGAPQAEQARLTLEAWADGNSVGSHNGPLPSGKVSMHTGVLGVGGDKTSGVGRGAF